MLRPTRKNWTAPSKVLAICCLLLAFLSFANANNSDFSLHQSKEEEQKPPKPEPEEEKPDLPEYDTELERKFDYLNAFLQGFRSKETIPSALNCTKYLEGSILKMNETSQSWKEEEVAADMTTKDYVFNTTSWISYDLAPSSRYCFSSTLQIYVWALRKNEQFDTWGDVFAAWLQNLLGNVITFQKLHDKIKEAEEAENAREMYYWYGRFWTLFINFEPIEEDTFEDEEFEQRGNDFFSLVPQQHKQLRDSRINDEAFVDFFDGPLVESPRVQGIFSSALGFTAGYMNASLGNASPNSGICQTNLTRLVTSMEDFYGQTQEASEESLQEAVLSAEDVLASVHPIAFSCYYSGHEFGDAADYYLLTLKDFSLLSYNVIHEGGKLYDTIYYLRKHQGEYTRIKREGTDEERAQWWYKLGIYYGTATFLVFYSPPTVDPFDPLEEYQGLDNGAHLDYYDDDDTNGDIDDVLPWESDPIPTDFTPANSQ